MVGALALALATCSQVVPSPVVAPAGEPRPEVHKGPLRETARPGPWRPADLRLSWSGPVYTGASLHLHGQLQLARQLLTRDREAGLMAFEPRA